MRFDLLRVIGFWLVSFLPLACAGANTTTIAITGGDAPGAIGAQFNDVAFGTLNDHGEIAFSASLEQGVGGVTSGDDTGVWLVDGSGVTLLAREGVGNVPGVADASFQSFQGVSLSNSGAVAVRAALQTGVGGVTSTSDQGLWRYTSGGGSLEARTGSNSVPDVVGADFSLLSSVLTIAGDGRMVLNAALNVGVGGVSSNNDTGLWSYDGTQSSLVAREGVSSAPGVGGSVFDAFGTPTLNGNDQLTFGASLKIGSGVTVNDKDGVWRYTGANGTLLARTGVGGVPNVPGESFAALGPPGLNTAGEVVFRATLGASASVNAGNDQGLWQYTGAQGTLLAREGVGGVPDVAGANFNDFGLYLLNDAGQVAVLATLQQGVGGVDIANDVGLWFVDGDGSLVARTGSGGVPNVPGADFSDITNVALNANGRLAVAATLDVGVGGVTANDNSGLWLMGDTGDPLLVARTGDTLAGRTIASLGFFGGSGGSDGRPRGWNNNGQLLYQATFTNGDSGLFLFSPDNAIFTADFDGEGDVDSQDLA